MSNGRPGSAHAKDYEYCGVKIGDKFGDLKVVKFGRIEKFDSGSTCGVVDCECSQEHIISVLSYYLTNGWITKCPLCNGDSFKEDNWLMSIAREIYRECFDKSTKRLKYGQICDLGSSIVEIKKTISGIPGWKYRETTLWFIDPDKGYTIYHPIHGNKVWVCLDIRTGQHYKCVGNLRWIPSSEVKQRAHDITVEQLENVARSSQAFSRICETRHWNPNEFNREWQSSRDGRKGWLYTPKPEFITKYKFPLRDLSNDGEIITLKGDEE